jgi:hypothetical protein
MSRIGTTDFYLEAARGNVDGVTTRGVVASRDNIGTSFEDIWNGVATSMVYPTAAETWEIVSSSVNDTSAGTGVRTVLINSLDDSYIPQSQIATLNGTTPVALTGTHYRPNGMIAITAGSLLTNDGTITLRVSGGGNERNVIIPGNGASTDAHITVPAGQTYHLLQVVTILGKNFDGDVRTLFRGSSSDSPWVASGDLPYYQAPFSLPIEARIGFPEKTDIKFQAKLSSSGGAAKQVAEYAVVDD